ncbi:hypothetical protein FAF44_35085 [Nonomuraea sp. MG754425]|uniref:hypothetical protein n=1 Tax=Nonomuraea sp. MG754425 TaxID=2570319 RepID=UPI001F23C3A1|nr:hypothetical protein [Nonomuraea sp. MG754425]MCF6473573.1 hypothetical protein [Nonomuraea sp. MG754425]
MTAIPLPIRRDEVCRFRPDPEFTRLRAQEPVLRVDLPSGDSAYLISRYEDVRQVFGDKDGFGVGDVPVDILRDTADETRPHIPGNLLGYDPPERTGLRRLLTGQFTMRRMEWLKPRVTEILHNRLDAMEAAGVPADLLAEFALPAPSLVIWELLRVPYEDRRNSRRGRTCSPTWPARCRRSRPPPPP